ncbi:hypothetical protein [Terracidiphilus sp.]|uniref:hypothetical protein n=1 Tax=Terracidiphilus sp. TaxID=1964191 RepID=UPI003C21D90C
MANGVDSGRQKAMTHLNAMLVAGETSQSVALQRRIFALLHRRLFVAATTGRLIGIERGLLGGFSPVDLRWQDIKSAHIQQGIFGSHLTITALTQPDLAIGGAVRKFEFNGLNKEEAAAIYRICQAQEQAWREKRRLRELEEIRAKSGGFVGNFGSGNVGSPPEEDPVSRLKKAKAMLEQGLISDSEYETIKARVVGQI